MIKELPGKCLFLHLPKFEDIGSALASINEMVSDDSARDAIVDLTRVEMLTSAHMANLMILRNMLAKQGQKLILCGVPFQIKCEFTVLGLNEMFEFASDKVDALETLSN